MAGVPPLRERFSSALESIAGAFTRCRPPRRFANVEGAAVEQHPDARLKLHHAANYAAALAILTDRAGPRRVLELGCGSGRLSREFARLMPADWKLVATDRTARWDGATAGLEFRRLDAVSAGFDELGGFDDVMMLELIEHFPPHQAAKLLHRLHAGLASGARVVFSTPDRTPFPRAHSGYGPHPVEYSSRTMRQRLADHSFNPFEHWRLWRLCSAAIVRQAVRAENSGGYLVNRAAAVLESYGLTRFALRVALATGSAVCSLLPSANVTFDWSDVRIAGDEESADESSSFSIVALLEKR